MLNCFRCLADCHFWFTIKFKCSGKRLMVSDSLPCQILSLQAWYYRTVYIVAESLKEICCWGIEDPKGGKRHSLDINRNNKSCVNWIPEEREITNFQIFLWSNFTGIFSQDPACKVVPRHNTSFVRLCTRAKEMKEFGWIVIWEHLRGGMTIESLS